MHYKTLGIPATASASVIREAYRRLARQYHPDFNPGDKSAAERFKNVQEAYEVLSDPRKRQTYDDVNSFWDGGSSRTGSDMPGGADQHPARKADSFENTGWMQEEGLDSSSRDFYVPGFGEKRVPPAGVALKDVLKSFLADAAIGLLAMVVAFEVARRYGGFNFAEPWLFALPIPHFVAGFLFGYTPGNCWMKAARINTLYLLYVGYIIANDGPQWGKMWPDLALVYPPTVLGVYLRHLLKRIVKSLPVRKTS